MTKNKPPNFWQCFSDALRQSAGERGIRAYIPWWLFLSSALLPGAVYLWPSVIGNVEDGASIALLAAIAVVGGFLGSVSIAAITQIQKMVSEYPFSDYLKEERLFDVFLFWPQFVLLFQIAQIIISTVSAVAVVVIKSPQWNLYLLGFNIGFMFYVTSKTWGLLEIIRILTWHYEDYFRLKAEAEHAARASS